MDNKIILPKDRRVWGINPCTRIKPNKKAELNRLACRKKIKY